MESRQCMFSAGIVSSMPNVSMPIASLIPLEVVELLRSTPRQRSTIAIMRVIPVIHVSVEPTRPMEPRPRADKHSTIEPVRPIVPIWCAIIRCIVEVPIRAIRRGPNAHNNLRGCHLRRTQRQHSNSRQNQRLPKGHNDHLLILQGLGRHLHPEGLPKQPSAET
jgi:hypothetical protein